MVPALHCQIFPELTVQGLFFVVNTLCENTTGQKRHVPPMLVPTNLSETSSSKVTVAMTRIIPIAALCMGAVMTLNACGPGGTTVDSSTVATMSSSSLGSSEAGSSSFPDVETSRVASRLAAPWSVTFHEDTPLVSERDAARILEVTDSGHTRAIGHITEAAPGGEGGLLGLAAQDGFLYAYVTTAGDNRVIRMALTGEPGALGLDQAEVIFAGIPKAATHNGGRIGFGPDGRLYITTGDTDRPDSAQDLESFAGKILRINPDDGSVPADNPFSGSPVFSMGHRNPQGIAWDAEGTMYASEFGQSTWDELNIITAGGNYGWPVVEGRASRDGFIDPVQQWRPAEASPSGMAITDDAIFIANLRGQTLREVPLSDRGFSRTYLTGEFGRLRDVVRSPDGAKLLVLTNNTDGRGQPGEMDDVLLRIDDLSSLR